MRHTPCGCCSAHLIEVQPNSRLPPASSMRRAPAMPLFRTQSAAVLPSLAPHDSKARLQNGYESQGFMAKPCTPHPIAQRMQSFKRPTANVGGRGGRPSSFSGGFKGGILFEKRIPPLPRAPQQVGPPIQRPRRCKTHAPLSGAKKGALYGTYNESHCQNPL